MSIAFGGDFYSEVSVAVYTLVFERNEVLRAGRSVLVLNCPKKDTDSSWTEFSLSIPNSPPNEHFLTENHGVVRCGQDSEVDQLIYFLRGG
jgi:hypothetical protein